jgi:hypothetical protein
VAVDWESCGKSRYSILSPCAPVLLKSAGNELLESNHMKLFRYLVSALLLLPAPLLQAVVVEDLHRALVPVEDHSERALARATREGLSQVFVKMSGSPEVLENPLLRKSLATASSYMQRYRYLRLDDGSLQLQVHFDPQQINDLLLEASAPLWTANRPALLVWLVIDDGSQRRFATSDSDPQLFERLTQELERRGVPAVYPLYDLQDTLSLDVQDLWRMNELAIFSASRRYGIADVLVARLTGLPGERWMGDWIYLYNQTSSAASFYGEPVPVFTANAVDFVADRMANRYAVAAGNSQDLEVLVRVDAVTDFVQYQAVLGLLENIELVDDAWPAYLEGESVVFRLSAQADPEQLDRIVSLNRRLQRLDAAVPLRRGPLNLDLVYRWNP